MTHTAAQQPKRLALIGYGTAGAFFHAPLIAATPDLHLAAVVTGDTGRAAAVRARYPDTQVLTAAAEVWVRAADFDAVVIASPNGLHAEQALAAIAAGLAVVVDKPLAVNVDQAEHIITAATRRGVPLSVFHNRRWDADFLTLQRLIEKGELGTVRRFESRFERWRPEPKPGWKRAPDSTAGGGILFDLGSHLIDQARLLFGPVASVYAELDGGYPDSLVDDDSFLALTHASGVRTHLWMSSVAADHGPRLRALGSRAAFVKYGLDGQEARLREGATPGGSDWGEEPEARHGRLIVGAHATPITPERGDYPAFYRAFARSLSHGAPPPVAAEDALAGLEVIAAARQAARDRRVVQLKTAAD